LFTYTVLAKNYFYRFDDRGMILSPISYAAWVLGWFNESQPASFLCRHHLFVCSFAVRLSSPNDLGFLSQLRRASFCCFFSFALVLPLCYYLTSPILRTLRHPYNYALRVPWLEKHIPQLTFTLLADGKQHPSSLPLVAHVLRSFSLLSPLYHNCMQTYRKSWINFHSFVSNLEFNKCMWNY